MNKINPLYTFAFFAIMALFMIFQSSGMDRKITEQAQQNAETELLGKQMGTLKARWKNTAEATRKIDSILTQKKIAGHVKSKVKKQNVYTVRVSELSGTQLDWLSAKILNETLPVKSITMVRNDDKNVTVDLEFAL